MTGRVKAKKLFYRRRQSEYSRDEFFKKSKIILYHVTGTQAEKSHLNCLIVMKMGNLHSTQPKEKDEEDSSDSEDEDEDDKPNMETAMINHVGAINRIRVSVVLVFTSQIDLFPYLPLCRCYSKRAVGTCKASEQVPGSLLYH